MKIGITERGDAGIDLSWFSKIENHEVNGAVLISKNFTEDFEQKVLNLHKRGYKIIVHCTCTGFGKTKLEPNVPEYKEQLQKLKNLIERGFPAEQCVLRIDPIFPSEKGLNKVKKVLNYFISLKTGVTRIRVSIVDEYRHVKERYRAFGWKPLYGDNFGPSQEQQQLTADVLNQFPFTYELCAEDRFYKMLNNGKITGCISETDLRILDIPYEKMSINPQHRTGCHCLACKTELLTNKKQCPHKCVYCFWKQS